ncbi:MAG: histidine kinase, partial [Nitrospiraceae bacterium]
MRQFIQVFNNLPIVQKLLLTSIIPIIALVLLSLVTYESVQTFSNDEEQLNNIYLVQRRAAEYMRLIVDLETGFRGYVLTEQNSYLEYPYQFVKERIVSVGDSLEQAVGGREPQHKAIMQVQQRVKQLIREKDQLIEALAAGRPADALDYIERGVGRAHMMEIRELMTRFDRLEQDVLNEALMKLAQDRTSMMRTILGGGTLTLVLIIFTLYLIAQSITGPLTTLAKAVSTVSGGMVPQVPVLDRKDEIGNLTRVMSAMSAQLSEHIARVEKSEAELRIVNQHLAASESKYRSIVDHAPLGIFSTKGTAMTFVNRYNRVLAGLNPDEEGDPEAVRQSIHPEDHDRVLNEFAKAVEENRAYETVFRFLHKDGTVRKVLSRRIPIQNEHGETVMYQGFNIDITALDQLQAQLIRA